MFLLLADHQSNWSFLLSLSSDCLFVTDYFTRTPRKLNAFRSFASVELFHFNVPDDTVVAVWNLITFKEQGGTFGDSCPDRNVTVWVGQDFHLHSVRGSQGSLSRLWKVLSLLTAAMLFQSVMLMLITPLCWLATLTQCVLKCTRKWVPWLWSLSAISIKKAFIKSAGVPSPGNSVRCTPEIHKFYMRDDTVIRLSFILADFQMDFQQEHRATSTILLFFPSFFCEKK